MTRIGLRAAISGAVGGFSGVVIGVSVGFGPLGVGIAAGLVGVTTCLILRMMGK